MVAQTHIETQINSDKLILSEQFERKGRHVQLSKIILSAGRLASSYARQAASEIFNNEKGDYNFGEFGRMTIGSEVSTTEQAIQEKRLQEQPESANQ